MGTPGFPLVSSNVLVLIERKVFELEVARSVRALMLFKSFKVIRKFITLPDLVSVSPPVKVYLVAIKDRELLSVNPE